MTELVEIRCPTCNALNLKIYGSRFIDIKLGAFKLIGEGKFDRLEITCRNRDCKNVFIIDQSKWKSEV